MSHQNEQERFDRIYEVFFDRLYAASRLITHDDQLAEEAVQDAFMAAYKQLDRFLQMENPLPWLMAVVCNKAIDHLRARSRQPKPLDDDALQRLPHMVISRVSQDPCIEAEMRELQTKALEWLDGLNEDQRQAVVLVYYSRFTCQEAAEVQNIPVGTIKSRLHRGLQVLARVISSDPYMKEVGRDD